MMRKDKKKMNISSIYRSCITSLIILGSIISFTACGLVEGIYDEKELPLSTEQQINQLYEQLEVGEVIPSEVISRNYNGKKEIALLFEGLADRGTMELVLELLDEYQVKATFFIPGIRGRELDTVVQMIKKQGHSIGNYGLTGSEEFHKFSGKKIIEEVYLTQNILTDIVGTAPKLMKANGNQYSEELLETLSVCEIPYGVKSDYTLNYHSFQSEQQVRDYISRVYPGRVMSIKLDGELTELEYIEKEEEVKPEEDTQDIENPIIKPDKALTETEALLQMLEWILKALKEESYKVRLVEDYHTYNLEELELLYKKPETNSVYYEKLIEENKGEKLQAISETMTTSKYVGFIFRGISNDKTLTQVLDTLDALKIRATFFVTGIEAKQYKDQVYRIIERGHEIGNGGYSGKNLSESSTVEICQEINLGAYELQEIGVKSNLYMPNYGVVTENIELAAATMKVKLISYVTAMVTGENTVRDYKQIVLDHFGNRTALKRGEIIYFRLDYSKDEKYVAELVQAVYENKVANTMYTGNKDTNNDSMYQAVTVSELLEDKLQYTLLTDGKTNLKTRELSEKEIKKRMQQNYIGQPDINYNKNTIGFSQEEKKLLNNTGRIDTKGENIIFLTIDDWGSDAIINQLLYVLDKHNVKATFFIRTNNVIYNTNLLRAIALDGHEIASHTDSHIGIAVETPKEIQELKQDLVHSEEVLYSIVGDTNALAKVLRPPRLEVSREGLIAAWELGYEYVVNGDFTTHDYKAKSAEELYGKLVSGIGIENRKISPGSILIMHMSDNSKFTPEALDLYLTANANKPDTDKTKFKVEKLGEYLRKTHEE